MGTEGDVDVSCGLIHAWKIGDLTQIRKGKYGRKCIFPQRQGRLKGFSVNKKYMRKSSLPLLFVFKFCSGPVKGNIISLFRKRWKEIPVFLMSASFLPGYQFQSLLAAVIKLSCFWDVRSRSRKCLNLLNFLYNLFTGDSIEYRLCESENITFTENEALLRNLFYSWRIRIFHTIQYLNQFNRSWEQG